MNMKYLIKDTLGFFYYNFYYQYMKKKGNRILIYHAFGTKFSHDTYGISIDPHLFEEHMKYLKDNYTLLPISLETYNVKLETDSISITIDDGYKDTLIAVEILEKYNIPYTIYMATGFINKNNYLSEKDLQNISKSSLATIGSHTISHKPLPKLSYKQQLSEINDSKKMLEDILQKEIITFSYPYGLYNKNVQQITENTYDIICTSNIGINSVGNIDIKQLKRIEIIASDDIKSLEKKVKGYYDYLGV